MLLHFWRFCQHSKILVTICKFSGFWALQSFWNIANPPVMPLTTPMTPESDTESSSKVTRPALSVHTQSAHSTNANEDKICSLEMDSHWLMNWSRYTMSEWFDAVKILLSDLDITGVFLHFQFLSISDFCAIGVASDSYYGIAVEKQRTSVQSELYRCFMQSELYCIGFLYNRSCIWLLWYWRILDFDWLEGLWNVTIDNMSSNPFNQQSFK